jgi:IS5 family transposase
MTQDDADQKLAAWNGPIHKIRCRIEKIFGTWTRSYGFRRMRWRGRAKAHLHARLTAIADILKRTRNILMPA